jgi:uncharacterized membrane protein
MMYSQGSYSSFDPPGSIDTSASGINNAGQIVGEYSVITATPAEGGRHGFLKDGNIFTSIDYPGSNGCTGITGINNKAQPVGNCYLSDQTFGFVDIDGIFTKLVFPGAKFTAVWGINDDGVIVGSYWLDWTNGADHGFIYHDGTYTSFDYGAEDAIFGINNLGDMVGWYTLSMPEAFRLARRKVPGNLSRLPVPEP